MRFKWGRKKQKKDRKMTFWEGFEILILIDYTQFLYFFSSYYFFAFVLFK